MTLVNSDVLQMLPKLIAAYLKAYLKLLGQLGTPCYNWYLAGEFVQIQSILCLRQIKLQTLSTSCCAQPSRESETSMRGPTKGLGLRTACALQVVLVLAGDVEVLMRVDKLLLCLLLLRLRRSSSISY